MTATNGFLTITLYMLVLLVSTHIIAETRLPLAKVMVTHPPVELIDQSGEIKVIRHAKYVYAGDKIRAFNTGTFNILYLGTGVSYFVNEAITVSIKDSGPYNKGKLLVTDNSKLNDIFEAVSRKFTIQSKYTGVRRDDPEQFNLPRRYTASDSFREIVWRNVNKNAEYEIVIDGDHISKIGKSWHDVLLAELPVLQPGAHQLEIRIIADGTISSSESLLIWLDHEENKSIASDIVSISQGQWGDDLLAAILLEKQRLDSAAYVRFESFFSGEDDSELLNLREKNNARLMLIHSDDVSSRIH